MQLTASNVSYLISGFAQIASNFQRKKENDIYYI